MGVTESYIDGKYSDGGPSAGRFDPDPSELHSSHLSECQRKRWWKHRRDPTSEPSVYFELGRVFEMMYGAALAYEHDPDITGEVITSLKPWEVCERSTVVVQDVNVEIDVGDGSRIVGECDWVVLTDDADSIPAVSRADSDGPVEWVDSDGDEIPGAPPVEKVVETKTKKDVSWIRRFGPDQKHVYQVYPYMHALGSDGEIAYMQRNDWEERVVPLRYDESVWTDCLVRARTHARNLASDDVPPPTPLDEDECGWCPYSAECSEMGGPAWL